MAACGKSSSQILVGIAWTCERTWSNMHATRHHASAACVRQHIVGTGWIAGAAGHYKLWKGRVICTYWLPRRRKNGGYLAVVGRDHPITPLAVTSPSKSPLRGTRPFFRCYLATPLEVCSCVEKGVWSSSRGSHPLGVSGRLRLDVYCNDHILTPLSLSL